MDLSSLTSTQLRSLIRSLVNEYLAKTRIKSEDVAEKIGITPGYLSGLKKSGSASPIQLAAILKKILTQYGLELSGTPEHPEWKKDTMPLGDYYFYYSLSTTGSIEKSYLEFIGKKCFLYLIDSNSKKIRSKYNGDVIVSENKDYYVLFFNERKLSTQIGNSWEKVPSFSILFRIAIDDIYNFGVYACIGPGAGTFVIEKTELSLEHCLNNSIKVLGDIPQVVYSVIYNQRIHLGERHFLTIHEQIKKFIAQFNGTYDVFTIERRDQSLLVDQPGSDFLHKFSISISEAGPITMKSCLFKNDLVGNIIRIEKLTTILGFSFNRNFQQFEYYICLEREPLEDEGLSFFIGTQFGINHIGLPVSGRLIMIRSDRNHQSCKYYFDGSIRAAIKEYPILQKFVLSKLDVYADNTSLVARYSNILSLDIESFKFRGNYRIFRYDLQDEIIIASTLKISPDKHFKLKTKRSRSSKTYSTFSGQASLVKGVLVLNLEYRKDSTKQKKGANCSGIIQFKVGDLDRSDIKYTKGISLTLDSASNSIIHNEVLEFVKGSLSEVKFLNIETAEKDGLPVSYLLEDSKD